MRKALRSIVAACLSTIGMITISGPGFANSVAAVCNGGTVSNLPLCRNPGCAGANPTDNIAVSNVLPGSELTMTFENPNAFPITVDFQSNAGDSGLPSPNPLTIPANSSALAMTTVSQSDFNNDGVYQFKTNLVSPTGSGITYGFTCVRQPAPTLTLVKVVTNANGGTKTAADFPLTATGSVTITGTSGAGTITSASVQAGTYALSEATAPGYTASPWVCTGTGSQSGSNITLANGQSATCTITNSDQPANLTLIKTVSNTNGGTATPANFTLTATGPTTISGAGGVAATPVSPGSYALSETSLPGYTASAWSCTGGTLTGSNVAIANGQSAICSITNSDQPANLTLVKTVSNTNGGTKTAADFTLNASGPTPLSGAGGVAATPVSAGSYALSETSLSGYTAGAWSCVGGTQSGNNVAIANGQSAICSITNSDQPGTLTLAKTVVNANGGTKTAADFPLTANGPTPITGVSGTAAVTSKPVSAGTYALSEVVAAGYTASAWSCVGGTQSGNNVAIANGQSAICSITNSDQPGTLTLVKTVVNANGGTKTAADFPLTANGPTPITGVSGTAAVTSKPVSAGTYALSEVVAAGYTASAWSCTGGTLTGSNVAIANGQNATCSITNSDQPATLTLTKTVVNANGGTKTVADFPLTATGPTLITGVSGTAAVTSKPVSAGTYTLSEVTAAGYTATGWSCTAGSLAGNSLTLSNGQSAACSITNTDQPGTLSLVKNIVNANGGTRTVADFPLTATGPTTFTGISGTAAVTAKPVTAGTYLLSEAAVAGYSASAWSCSAGTLTGNSLLLGNGQSSTCTITNSDQPATLTLAKVVSNTNGGTKSVADFPLTATGPTTFTGVSGTAAVTGKPVSAGTYALSEVTANGYTASAWSCSAGTLAGSNLTLTNGQSASCSITNSDRPATLTLVKSVVNSGGGTKTVADFPLSATGPTVITGVSGTASVTNASVKAGSYALSEVTVSGYSASAWSCTGTGSLAGSNLALANGQSATCSITNSQDLGTITIVKTAAAGGPATFGFASTIPGNAAFNIATSNNTQQVVFQNVATGSYSVTEQALSGWSLAALSCNDANSTGSVGTRTATINVDKGENVTCTFVNTRDSGTVTVNKTAIGGDGTFSFSGSGIASFSQSVTTSGGSGSTGPITILTGSLTITESLASGFDLTSISCTGGSPSVDVPGRKVTIAVTSGASIACTFVNARRGAITVRKNTIGADGTFSFTSSNAALPSFSLTTANGTASKISSTLASGTYAITEVVTDGWSLSAIHCAGGASTSVSTQTKTATINLSGGENVVCTFLNTEVRNRTSNIIRNFLNRRADLLTSDTGRPRLVERQQQQTAAAAPSGAVEPMKLGGSAEDGSGRFTFSTSLAQMRAAKEQVDVNKMAKLGGTDAGYVPNMRLPRPGYDVWMEGSYSFYDYDSLKNTGAGLSGDKSSGRFSLMRVGADYLLKPWMLVGTMIQFDRLSEKSNLLGYRIDGTGWMAGPYAEFQINKNLIFDVKGLYGKSENQISPFLTYVDTFETTRWLLSGRLTGSWHFGAWHFSPRAEIVGYNDKQKAYTDSLGILIPQQSVSIGRLIVGPELSYKYQTPSGGLIEPRVGVKGLYTFSQDSQRVLGTLQDAPIDTFRARLEFGVKLQDPKGTRLEFSGSHEGLGESKLNATSGKVQFTLPLN